MEEIYLHVGPHKTASTYLQQHIFNQLEGFDYYGPTSDITKKLHPQNYNISDEKAGSVNVDELNSLAINNKVLISSENWFGEHNLGYQNRFSNCDIIKKLIPAAKIIIIIRKQDDWLKSLYKQNVQKGSYFSFEDFVAQFGFDDNPFDVIDNYINNFGKENVHIIPYEKLLAEPDKFISDIASVLGYSNALISVNRFENKSVNDKLLVINRRLNYFLCLLSGSDRSNLNKYTRKLMQFYISPLFDKLSHSKKQLSVKKDQFNNILRRAEPYNRILDKEFNLNLTEYGYYE